MKRRSAALLALLALAAPFAWAQGSRMTLPKTIEAGTAFSIQTSGTGKATLYIVGLGGALKRDIQLGEQVLFPTGVLYDAGQYLALLNQGPVTDTESFDVVPATQPAHLSFLAKPSRLPVGLHQGISGAVYVFDAYRNLITAPITVSFDLSNRPGISQQRTIVTRNGVAWTEMDSSAQAGTDEFVARAGQVSSKRVIEQVPGDPCGLKMTAQPAGKMLEVQTEAVRDCSGNAVPDGTIVTFTENYGGAQSTADVPLKHGIAQVEMPVHNGATISVASGVVLGNEIRWR